MFAVLVRIVSLIFSWSDLFTTLFLFLFENFLLVNLSGAHCLAVGMQNIFVFIGFCS